MGMTNFRAAFTSLPRGNHNITIGQNKAKYFNANISLLVARQHILSCINNRYNKRLKFNPEAL